jgi:uncharacterized protein YkwD
MPRLIQSPARLLLAFALIMGAAIVGPATRLFASPAGQPATLGGTAHQPTLRAAAVKASSIPVDHEDFQTEQRLLTLANQSRQQAGAPPLTMDAGLSQAARIHAQAMVQARRLSHRFDGEPSLPQRLAATTQLQLEQEGENVALDYDAEHGHEDLMLSPPHRANLLNPAYNVVGMGVVRSGNQIYIVQDFGSAIPKYSLAEVKQHVATAVNQTRRQASRPELQRRDGLDADTTACSMARSDKLGMPASSKPAERFTVLTYTSLHPEVLPGAGARAVAGRDLRSFSIGVCYRRTPSYPTGVYWIVLSLE